MVSELCPYSKLENFFATEGDSFSFRDSVNFDMWYSLFPTNCVPDSVDKTQGSNDEHVEHERGQTELR